MSILWEPPSEAREQDTDLRGVRQREENRPEPYGVSARQPRPLHHHDADDAPSGDKLIVLFIGALSGGMVGLVLGYALGVL